MTDPIWAILFVGALFIGGAWRFGKDLEEAAKEMKKRREDED